MMNLELNDKTYNVLKWAGLIAIPALGVFVGTVGPVWGLPQTDAIVTTLNALGTLIGALICVSSVSYNKKGE